MEKALFGRMLHNAYKAEDWALDLECSQDGPFACVERLLAWSLAGVIYQHSVDCTDLVNSQPPPALIPIQLIRLAGSWGYLKVSWRKATPYFIVIFIFITRTKYNC